MLFLIPNNEAYLAYLHESPENVKDELEGLGDIMDVKRQVIIDASETFASAYASNAWAVLAQGEDPENVLTLQVLAATGVTSPDIAVEDDDEAVAFQYLVVQGSSSFESNDLQWLADRGGMAVSMELVLQTRLKALADYHGYAFLTPEEYRELVSAR